MPFLFTSPCRSLMVKSSSGKADMGIDGAWERRGVKVSDPKEYHL